MTKPISELYEWLMSLNPVERADWMETNNYEPATFGKTEREMGVSPRQLGRNPRSRWKNPRRLGTNPRRTRWQPLGNAANRVVDKLR